jgi:hypothetical protein
METNEGQADRNTFPTVSSFRVRRANNSYECVLIF